MRILDNKQIDQKIRRLAYEILEDNSQVKKLIFLGINSNGTSFATLLAEAYNKIATYPVTVGVLRLNPADPLSSCLLYTSPSPRDGLLSRMPSSA